MTCAEIEDRFYDEDCRSALLGRQAVPADVRGHLAHCRACGASWAQAAADQRGLAETLHAPVPERLRFSLYRIFRAAAPAPLVTVQMASWALTCGALCAGIMAGLLAASLASQLAGFCVGASIPFAAKGLEQAQVDWFAPWAVARSAAARCLGLR